jgi:hypothetical protein
MAVERAQQIIDQAAKERMRFIEWVHRVPNDVWANTSPDGTWQARDYVAHLASIDPLLTAWFRSLQRELPLHMFLSGWAYHDRWHMEDARRAIAGEPEQPFGDASFEQAMQGRSET